MYYLQAALRVWAGTGQVYSVGPCLSLALIAAERSEGSGSSRRVGYLDF